MSETPDAPRLMLVFPRQLSEAARANLRAAFAAARHSDKTVVVEGCKVFQLIGGRWQPLDSADAGADTSDPERCVKEADPRNA